MKGKEDDFGRPHDGDQDDGWNTCQLVGWEDEIRDDWGCFMWRPHFVERPEPGQKLDLQNPLAGRRFVLTPEQCRRLAQRLAEAADVLEDTGTPSPSGQGVH